MDSSEHLVKLFEKYDFLNEGRINKDDVILILEYELEIIITTHSKKYLRKYLASKSRDSLSFNSFKTLIMRAQILNSLQNKHQQKNILKEVGEKLAKQKQYSVTTTPVSNHVEKCISCPVFSSFHSPSQTSSVTTSPLCSVSVQNKQRKNTQSIKLPLNKKSMGLFWKEIFLDLGKNTIN